jgi:hypothetical protein
VELVEDALLLFRKNPCSAVGHLHENLPVRFYRRDIDRRSFRRVLRRILEQVHDDLVDEAAIEGRDEIGEDSDAHGPTAKSRLDAAERASDDLLQRLPLLLDLHRA